MTKVKVKCGNCKDCSPKRQKEVQETEWVPKGETPGAPDRTNLYSPKGKLRSCPTWAIGAVAPLPPEPEPEPDERDEPEEPELTEPPSGWTTDEGYGPKCTSCGAGRGEDHCSSCPYRKFEVCAINNF